MEQIVRVRRLCDNGKAEIIHVRESACSGDCHKCSGCGAAKETMIVEADNPIGAQPGDMVRVETATKGVMGAVAIFYALPLVLFFVGYAIGAKFGFGGIVAGIGFALGIATAVIYDRKYARHHEATYTIVGYVADRY